MFISFRGRGLVDEWAGLGGGGGGGSVTSLGVFVQNSPAPFR